jgi:hypothetical protein
MSAWWRRRQQLLWTRSQAGHTGHTGVCGGGGGLVVSGTEARARLGGAAALHACRWRCSRRGPPTSTRCTATRKRECDVRRLSTAEAVRQEGRGQGGRMTLVHLGHLGGGCRAARRALVGGIAAHKRGEAAVDPLTGVEVADPSSLTEEELARLAAYDHYSDSELRAAAAAGGGDGGAVLRGKITTRLIICALTSVVLVLGAVASVTLDNQDVASALVTTAALVGTLVVFIIAFDLLRVRHFDAVMAGSPYVESDTLQAHVDSMAQRTMGQPVIRDGDAVEQLDAANEQTLNPASEEKDDVDTGAD